MKVNVAPFYFYMCNLDYNIEAFKAMNNVKAYLIMSQDTADSIASHFNMPCMPSNRVNMYKGNNIFIDNDLPFGKVEIR